MRTPGRLSPRSGQLPWRPARSCRASPAMMHAALPARRVARAAPLILTVVAAWHPQLSWSPPPERGVRRHLVRLSLRRDRPVETLSLRQAAEPGPRYWFD